MFMFLRLAIVHVCLLGMMGDMMGGAMGSMFNHPLAQQQQQQPKIEKKDMNDRGYSIDCTEFNKLTDDPGRPEDVSKCQCWIASSCCFSLLSEGRMNFSFRYQESCVLGY